MAIDGLCLEDRFSGAADEVYATLILGHSGLSDEESAALNSRLILILSNLVGDIGLIEQAVALARGSLVSDGASGTSSVKADAASPE